MKPRIRETIIVEGRYDKNTVSQAVEANILETRGFGVFTDDALVALIRRLAAENGVIILTDSDGAGFLIRGKLKSVLGTAGVKHAFIPDIEGRERRKSSASKSGLLGVEGMSPEIITESLRIAGATFEGGDISGHRVKEPITKADMYELGLNGVPGSRDRRRALGEKLGLPRLLSSGALFEVLRCLYTREELISLMNELQTSVAKQASE